MKTVKIQGGLGNQLFGLAFAHSVQRLTGETVGLDLAAYGADRYARGFELQGLAERLGGFVFDRRPILASRALTALARRLPWPGLVVEGAAPTHAQALARLAARAAYFSGYWQDEAFIAEPEAFRAAARAELLARGGEGPAPNIAIHVRTYKEELREDRRGVPDAGYFRACVAHLKARGEQTGEIVLISDDPDLALQRLGDIGAPIVTPPRQSAWADMALLLRARNLILTNSSFSWWGGFCGEAQAIFYPARAGLFHYPRPAGRFEVI